MTLRFLVCAPCMALYELQNHLEVETLLTKSLLRLPIHPPLDHLNKHKNYTTGSSVMYHTSWLLIAITITWKIHTRRPPEISTITPIVSRVWWTEDVKDGTRSNSFKTVNIASPGWIENCCSTWSSHLTISNKLCWSGTWKMSIARN